MPQYIFNGTSSLVPNLKLFSPQTVGDELEKLRLVHEGELRASHIVEAWRDPNHKMHDAIDWDVGRASERDYLHQARMIIKAIEIYSSEIEKPIPAYINISAEDRPRAYYAIEDVVSDRRLRIATLRRIERDLEACQRRCRDLRDILELLAPVISAVRRRLDDEDRPSA